MGVGASGQLWEVGRTSHEPGRQSGKEQRTPRQTQTLMTWPRLSHAPSLRHRVFLPSRLVGLSEVPPADRADRGSRSDPFLTWTNEHYSGSLRHAPFEGDDLVDIL